jgi:hypothetical protein
MLCLTRSPRCSHDSHDSYTLPSPPPPSFYPSQIFQEILSSYLSSHPTSPMAVNLKACNAFRWGQGTWRVTSCTNDGDRASHTCAWAWARTDRSALLC